MSYFDNTAEYAVDLNLSIYKAGYFFGHYWMHAVKRFASIFQIYQYKWSQKAFNQLISC